MAILAVVVGGLSVACGLEIPEFLGGSQGGSDSGSGSEPTTEPAPEGAASPAENGRIAYQVLIGDVNSFEDTDIYSNVPQGGDEQRITDDGGAYPSYSPTVSNDVLYKLSRRSGVQVHLRYPFFQAHQGSLQGPG